MDNHISHKLLKRITLTILICLPAASFSQQADAVEGFWLTKDRESQIKIYQADNGKYEGKIIWLEEPYEEDGSVKRDDENPDESKQDRKILGLKILKGFEYDTDDQRWEDGKIYDPETGNTYKCYMWFDNDNTDVLNVKGYIGISLIGRKTEWTREKSQR